MAPIAAAWLRSMGLVVYAEVPHSGRSVDLVGASAERLVAVELKASLSYRVIYQAYSNQIFGTSWCVIASTPKATGIAQATKLGVGVARITHDASVVTIIEPKSPSHPWGPQVRRVRSYLDRLDPSDKGGRANLEGEGPAQDVYAAVQVYRAQNPSATWAQVFAAVPNHYAHARSLMMSMDKVLVRREWKQRRRESTLTKQAGAPS